jgi:hypothetical protein
MPTLKAIIGLETPSLLTNDQGKQYLKETDNPKAMYFLEGYLFVKSNNSDFLNVEITAVANTVYSLRQKENANKSKD